MKSIMSFCVTALALLILLNVSCLSAENVVPNAKDSDVSNAGVKEIPGAYKPFV